MKVRSSLPFPSTPNSFPSKLDSYSFPRKCSDCKIVKVLHKRTKNQEAGFTFKFKYIPTRKQM